MKKNIIILLVFAYHLCGFGQTCELIIDEDLTIEITNFSITDIAENWSDCTLEYTLDYKVNNPNGCGVNLQAVVLTGSGSQTTFTINTNNAWHTQTGKIYNTNCTGNSTIHISGGSGYPCNYKGINWPGISCATVSYPRAVPVELSQFTASEDKSKVVLNWITASEIDNEGFIIEHCTDGINFKEIGYVEGTGSTAFAQNYSFLHNNPAMGINYYRLKQIDYNEAFEYSSTISVELKNQNDILVFPNPTYGDVHIKMPTDFTSSYELYNQAGQLIQRAENVQSEELVSLHHLPSGGYIFRFQTDQGAITRRVIKW